MNEPELNPGSSGPEDPAHGENEDSFYHDDDDVIEMNDDDGFRKSVPVKKKPGRRLPPRPRHYMDD